MMRNKSYIRRMGLQGKLLLFLIGFFAVSPAISQNGMSGKNKILLIGQITSIETGAPIKNKDVIVMSDSILEPQFIYLKKVVTDNDGFYYDTIFTDLHKGSIKILTTDYLGDMHDTLVYYRFTWSEDNIIFANFQLPTPPVANNYQANFYFEKNPNGQNYLEYKFYDITIAEDILSWSWDFGDGTYSEEQHPEHLYTEPGLYRIELTVSILSAQYAKPFITTIAKIINIVPKSYFHMGGHVFAGQFPIDKSEVFLYKLEEKDYIPIDTAIFNDELGYYLFPQLIEGDYIVKADLHPSSELFNMFMTTYYSDKLHWEEADTIFHHSNNYEYDINLVPNTYAMSGPGLISGEVKFNFGSEKSLPAENIEIILFDEYDNAVDICHSNEDGEFELQDLNLDVYMVYAEVTGKLTYPVQVILEETNSEVTFVNLIIGNNGVNGSVNSSIFENLFNSGIGDIYPNPVVNIAQVSISNEIPGHIYYSITNCAGHVILTSESESQTGNSVISINLEDLKSGIYFLKLVDEKNRAAVRKFIKK